MLGDGSPEQAESFCCKIVGAELMFVFAAGMKIDNDRQILAHCFRNHGIEHLHGVATLPWTATLKDRRIDAQAHVIKAELVDECDVVERGIGREPLHAVVARLREPLAGIDSMAEMLCALPRRRRWRVLRETRTRDQ